MHCSRRIIVQTLVFSHSYLHRQVSPPETLVVKGGTTWAKNGQWILPENARLPRNIQGSFTCRKSTTWDKRLYFPSEWRRPEDFLPWKNPTAWAGFEPGNWGTKGQHATSRPPKPLHSPVTAQISFNTVEFCLPSNVGDCFVVLTNEKILQEFNEFYVSKNRFYFIKGYFYYASEGQECRVGRFITTASPYFANDA